MGAGAVIANLIIIYTSGRSLRHGGLWARAVSRNLYVHVEGIILVASSKADAVGVEGTRLDAWLVDQCKVHSR